MQQLYASLGLAERHVVLSISENPIPEFAGKPIPSTSELRTDSALPTVAKILIPTALLDPVRVEYPGTGSTPVKEHHPLRDFATVGVRDGALLVTCFDPEVCGLHIFSLIRRAKVGSDLALRSLRGFLLRRWLNTSNAPYMQRNWDLRRNSIREVMKACFALPCPGQWRAPFSSDIPSVTDNLETKSLPYRPTSETRAALLKDVTRVCENARVSIRSARHAAQKQLKLDTDRKIVGSSESKKEMKTVSRREMRDREDRLAEVVSNDAAFLALSLLSTPFDFYRSKTRRRNTPQKWTRSLSRQKRSLRPMIKIEVRTSAKSNVIQSSQLQTSAAALPFGFRIVQSADCVGTSFCLLYIHPLD